MRNTWFIDIDGTIVEHKNNKQLDDRLTFLGKKQTVFPYGESDIEDVNLLDEKILPGVKDFWLKIPEKDVIILTTAREYRHKWLTEQMLKLFELHEQEEYINLQCLCDERHHDQIGLPDQSVVYEIA